MKPPLHIITGASGHIGRRLVAKILEQGFTVVGLDCRDSFFDREENYLHCSVDLSQESEVHAACEQILEWNRPIHRLIHGAGVYNRADLSSLTWDMCLRTYEINTLSFIRIVQALKPLMLGQPTHVLALASDAAYLGPKLGIHYAASKGALISAVYSLARALSDGDAKILVNALVMGVVESPQAMLDEQRREKFLRDIPLKRLADADDIVKAIDALTSGGFDYCTGQKFCVNGGRNLL